jgi:hypothetical protein
MRAITFVSVEQTTATGGQKNSEKEKGDAYFFHVIIEIYRC